MSTNEDTASYGHSAIPDRDTGYDAAAVVALADEWQLLPDDVDPTRVTLHLLTDTGHRLWLPVDEELSTALTEMLAGPAAVDPALIVGDNPGWIAKSSGWSQVSDLWAVTSSRTKVIAGGVAALLFLIAWLASRM